MQASKQLRSFTGHCLLGMALCLASAIAASQGVALVEGYSYHTLPIPEAVTTGSKIEVLEVFSYGCVHCYDYQPAVHAFLKRMPKDASLVLLPATLNGNFTLYARGYFAAQSLGVADKLHDQVFEAVWMSGHPANNPSGLADLYASLGVDRDKFQTAVRSVAVEAKLSAAMQKSERMQVEGTPTFYVDGKYQVLTTAAQSADDVMARVEALVAKARAERAALKANPMADPKAKR